MSRYLPLCINGLISVIKVLLICVLCRFLRVFCSCQPCISEKEAHSSGIFPKHAAAIGTVVKKPAHIMEQVGFSLKVKECRFTTAIIK